MTLILSIGNSSQVIQISDRRLTSGRNVINDNSNKATCIICRNGRFAVGYAGLALVGSFNTQAWLLDTFFKCASPEYTIYEIVKRFAKRASQDFKQIPFLAKLQSPYKRLSIMLSGYLTHGEKPLIGNLIITNFQDFRLGIDYPGAKDEFWIMSELEKDDTSSEATFIQRVGFWQAMNSQDEINLRNLLRQHLPEEVLIDAAVDVVREIANRPESNNTIGKNLIVTVVPSDMDKLCVSIVKQYESNDVISFADNLTLLGTQFSFAVKEAKLILESSKNDEIQKNFESEVVKKVRKKRKRH